jgi:hypothetical protein
MSKVMKVNALVWKHFTQSIYATLE